MRALSPYLRGFALIASLLALGYLVKAMGLDGLMDEGWIDREIRGRGLTGDLVFLGAGAVLTAVGFPRQGVSFLGGYAFGFGEGTALALAASAGGCVMAFAYARLMGRALVRERLGARARRIDAFLHDNPFAMALLMRLLPVGSNLLANLAAGVSGVRPLPFIAGSVIGYIPQTMIFALLGSGLHLDPALRIGASVVLFVASGMIGLYLFRRFRRSHALDADLDALGDEGEERPS